SVATSASIRFCDKSSYFIGVLFSFRYNFPMVFPSDEIISEARFEDGFSNSSKVGISPKAPAEANKKRSATKAIPPTKSPQNHLMNFEKLLDCFSFLAITNYIFLCLTLRQKHLRVSRAPRPRFVFSKLVLSE